jgi:hypothetical protein
MWIGLHLQRAMNVEPIDNTFISGTIGGANTEFLSIKEAMEIANTEFQHIDMDTNAMYVFPIDKETKQTPRLKIGTGLYLTGAGLKEKDKTKYQYSHAPFWNAFWRWNQAVFDTSLTRTSSNRIAPILFPCFLAYWGKNKNRIVHEAGSTHWGPCGEQPGARDVRMLGTGLFPGVQRR